MNEEKGYAYIGTRAPRTDALAKVTGGAKYFGDVNLPGTLAVKILASPHPHAQIVSIDTSKAEQLPGVRAVITAKDIERVSLDPSEFMFFPIPPTYALATDKVRFIGEEVAAVAADNEDIAEEAIKLIDVKYEILDAVFDLEETKKPGAPRIYNDIENNIAIPMQMGYGDVEKGFEEADHIFEDTFRTQAQYHSIMERLGCVCSWDTEGNLTMWTPTQTPHHHQELISGVLGIPMNKLRIVCPHVGGGFGGRAHVVLPFYAICATLAKKTGKPVKMELTRAEDFSFAVSTPKFILKLKTGVKKDGKLIARQCEVIEDCGAHVHLSGGQMATVLTVGMGNHYKVPNFKADGYVVYTNNPNRVNAMRGFGNTQAHWAIESQMDIIAEKLGMDPIELRLSNSYESGETTFLGWKLETCGLPECIKKGAETAKWDQKRREKLPNRGIGMAGLIHVSGFKAVVGLIETSTVNLIGRADGSFDLYTGATEIGCGVWTVAQQVTAEIIGTRLDDIKITGGDTAITPFELGCYASRGTICIGHAAKIAATDMRRQLFEVAAPMLEASVEDLDTKDGQIYLKKAPDKKVSISEVAHHAHLVLGAALMSQGIYNAPSTLFDVSTHTWPPPGPAVNYPFACQVAEVEVNPKTGNVKVLSLVAVHDCGYSINLNSVEGQIEGGLSHGLGLALSEDLKFEEGRVLSTDMADYFVWRSSDMPPIKAIPVDTNDPLGPFGAKSIGETVFVPTAPAIANAIYDAVGVRIKDLPITSEKVLKALKEKG